MKKKILLALKGKLYIIPVLYSFTFSLLSILILIFDQYTYEKFSHIIPPWIFISGALSTSIFSLVSSSLITIVTVSFSIMMVVLTIYGSQLSSRSLQDFLAKKITLRILGYFVGTLIFSLIQLTYAKSDANSYIIAPTIAIMLLIVGVIILIYFIHFISKSIQIAHYIDDVVKETLGLLEASKKLLDSSIYIQGGKIEDYSKSLEGEVWEVLTVNSGYIQYYDQKKLIEISKSANITVLCEILIGEHILPNKSLMKVYGLQEDADKEALTIKLLEAVYIGYEPDLYKDISTGTKRLVDVALKALSPGINDPSTAVLCINKIGYLLLEIAKGLEANIFLDDDGDVRVIIRSISFNRLLYNHFYQIKHYGMTDLFVIDAILSALTMISRESSWSIKRKVWDFAKYLIEDLHLNRYHDIEQRALSEKIYQLSKAVGVDYDFYGWRTFDKNKVESHENN